MLQESDSYKETNTRRENMLLQCAVFYLNVLQPEDSYQQP
jgi:hypothetical protein